MTKNLTVITTILLSIISSILWILGLISGNIYMYIASLVIVIIMALIAIKDFDEINEFFSKRQGRTIEDERTKIIDEKAAVATIGITVVIIVYLAIGLLTLRNVYPGYLNTAYLLILIAVLMFIINLITRQYYKNKY